MKPLAHQAYENNSIEDDHSSQYISQLYPYMKAYHSSIPSTWSFLFTNLYEFIDTEKLIFRDGVLTLIHFFKRFPSPGQTKTKFYIAPYLLAFVPPIWRTNFGSFSIATSKSEHNQPIIISGIPNCKMINQIVYSLKSHVTEKSNIILLFPDRESLNIASEIYEHIDVHYAFIKLLQVLNDTFKTSHIRLCLDSNITNLQNIDQHKVFDLAPFSFELSDSTISHALFSLGAKQINILKHHSIDKDKQYVPLSLHHGIDLHNDVLYPAYNIYDDFNIKTMINTELIWEQSTDMNIRYVFTDELYHFGYYCLRNFAHEYLS